jgi:hypothetical protein
VTVLGKLRVDTFKMGWRGDEPARIAASGDGHADLDLYVYDEHSNPACSDADDSDDTYCGWTPSWTGTTVRIKRHGTVNRDMRVTH